MSTRFLFKSFVILSAVAAPTLSLWATGRTTISLNGTWQIEDSKEAEAIPVAWNHKVEVPASRIPPNLHFRRWISSIAGC